MHSPQALVCRPSSGKNKLSLEDIAVPSSLEPHQVLVRITAVAQNPTDVQCFDGNAFGDGAVLGCDFCGVVERIGSDVGLVDVGDRIAGLIWGGEIKGLGAYATHTVADESICFKVPSGVSSEAAATVPLALTTAWLAFFSSQSLNIDKSRGAKNQILIWGGSSSIGLYAIQIARIFGFQVATVCTNFEIVRSAGPSKIFDYRSPTVIEDIKSALPDIAYVFDCIGSETSSVQASKAVRESGGTLCTVRPGKAFCEDIETRVTATDVVVWTAFQKDHRYGKFFWPASEEDRAHASQLYRKLSGWLEDGTIKPNKVRVVDGGLQGVSDGFQLYRDKKISGEKIVYQVS